MLARDIISEVAAEYGVTVDAMVGRSKKGPPAQTHRVFLARQAAMIRIKTELKYSYNRIGRLFNRTLWSAYHYISPARREHDLRQGREYEQQIRQGLRPRRDRRKKKP